MPKRTIGDPRRNYAKEWKAWRRKKKWTQKDMALAVGVCIRTVRNIENKHGRPQFSTRYKLDSLQRRHRQAIGA